MDHFYQQLNQDLKNLGGGVPQLVIDQQRLSQNVHYVLSQLQQAAHLQPRLVVKSLANMELLQYLSQRLHTQRLMVFHIAHLHRLLEVFPQADMLLGKPMPIQAVRTFYQQHKPTMQGRIQWLVDQLPRLQQYRQLAQQLNMCMDISIEIDVGLHRGGINHPDLLEQMLKEIQQYPQYLHLAGLMGYDAHVTKVPGLISKADLTYQNSQAQYQRYIDVIRQKAPSLWSEQLCLNGGGSPTFSFHVKQSVCNDLSFGSMLLKPTDFDLPHLTALQPALFIAAPVLKNLAKIQLPGMELLDKFNLPSLYQGVFIYGGYWMGQYVYPEGSKPHMLYGRSTNQELVCVPKAYPVSLDDHIFLRPSQSEVVIPQFEHTYLYCAGQGVVQEAELIAWNNFRE